MCTCVRTYISVYDDCSSDFMLQVAFIIFRSKKLITDAINDNDFLKNLDKVSVFVPPNHTYSLVTIPILCSNCRFKLLKSLTACINGNTGRNSTSAGRAELERSSTS